MDYIKLYELLGEYKDLLESDKMEYWECADKTELAGQMMLSEMLRAIKLLQNVLVYEF